MKVYVVLEIKIQYDQKCKRSNASKEVVAVFQNKEKAYELAHNNLLDYVRDRYCPEGKQEWDRTGVDEYVRDETESWETSFFNVVFLLSDITEQLMIHDHPTHETFEVVHGLFASLSNFSLDPSMMPKKCKQETLPIRRTSPLGQKQRQRDHHPLAIPELIILISRFLDNNSLIVNLRVCQAWHRALLPTLWATITLDWGRPKTIPNSSVFQRHSALIRKLHFVTSRNQQLDFSDNIRVSCSNLSSLSFPPPCSGSNDDFSNESIVVELIKRHQSTLTVLWVAAAGSDKLLDTLANCHHLKDLTIDTLRLESPEQFLDRFDTLWSRIEKVQFGCPSSSFLPALLKNDDRLQDWMNTFHGHATKIKLLVLHPMDRGLPLQIQLFLILKSPDLVELCWHVHSDPPPKDISDPMALLSNAIRTGRLAFPWQLQSLAFPNRGFQNQDFKLVLETLEGLTRLDLYESSFDQQSWSIIKDEVPHYLTTLQSLDLQACDNASGDIIQEILSSMPALTIFKAEKISDEDVLRDGKRPWVCLRLRVLSLGLVLKNQDGNDGVFLTQLARLEQLEELNLGMLYTMSRYRWIVDDDDEANMPRYFLRFALDRGLDQLKKLRQLRRLEGTDMDTFTWSRDEARWVLENWVNFKELSCVGIDAEAEKLLLERGVDLDC